MARSGFKMKSAAHGGPMRKNFPSAFKVDPTADEKRSGSTQEVKLTSDSYYVDDKGSTASAAMTRLKRAEPPKGSKGHAAWQKAYDKASASYVKESKRDIAAGQ